MAHASRLLTLLAASLLALPLAARAQDPLSAVDEPAVAPAPAAAPATSAQAPATFRNYASLSELIGMICADAIHQFNGFFGPTLIRVEPFPFLWEFEHQRPSMLGITLADQMTAVLNGHTSMDAWSQRDQYATPDPDEAPVQWVQGTLQEMDGYLRLHISGSNQNGERRSYVVNAEMSESIYRALHTSPVRSRLHTGVPDPG
ncbi:MAG: hypothetical protein COZ12_08505 [Deltaproteobacteria bacterium CG_4_10_14_3_um_filter_60_8]|nr:MAG: hypothetical protein AUK28_02950 [Desulfobacterales bacterium CG2_30_60_27]PIP42909.1 MAG: hypothetical protein COX17_09965 [Deltaproteobacteria bacterium CG23_combo_of_CG06-09_8_20_14_all_60_8]PIY20729.1 MAG: hypothetical protein COZ12_08505 [Deltaproteobacteria bacterium CG_4_10_14_3_um_filter_60_8]